MAVLVAVAMGVAHPVGWRVIGRELIAVSKLKTLEILAFCLLLFCCPCNEEKTTVAAEVLSAVVVDRASPFVL